MSKSCVIFDLDNCLANDSWRIPFIRWHSPDPDHRWDLYHVTARHDPPPHNVPILDAARAEGHGVVISTARPLRYRPETEGWLLEHDVRYDALIMRNNADRRPSEIVKRSSIGVLCEYGFDSVHHAYDDRPEIVAMYLKNGIAATLLAIHSLNAYAHPAAVPLERT